MLQNNSNQKFKFGETDLDFTVVDFWKWNQSNLIENRNRGILAEFIVKQGLDIQIESRLEWDSYDLIKDDIKIEVKSAAYVQSWNQKKHSTISFNISNSRSISDDNKYSAEKTRQANIYIFYLLDHKDRTTINPLDLNQWTFYLVSTSILNNRFPTQKTIRLSIIECIEHKKCNYDELKDRFKLLTSS